MRLSNSGGFVRILGGQRLTKSLDIPALLLFKPNHWITHPSRVISLVEIFIVPDRFHESPLHYCLRQRIRPTCKCFTDIFGTRVLLRHQWHFLFALIARNSLRLLILDLNAWFLFQLRAIFTQALVYSIKF